MEEITLGVPSGIGDISWLVSKICQVEDIKINIEIADGWPYRAKPYVDLLPCVNKCDYGTFKFEEIVAFEANNPYQTWEDVVGYGYERFLIEPNLHLERGRPLGKWLPDLPTHYHYPFKASEQSRDKATELLGRCEHPILGLSAASYIGASKWKTWQREQWENFIHYVLDQTAIKTVLLLGGRWDDITDSLDGLRLGVYNLVGKTDWGVLNEVHKQIEYYIGFSSGLGIIRTVLGLPTYMLWPEHQQALSTSWADPEDLDSGRYKATMYMDEVSVFRILKAQMRKFSNGCA